MKLILASKKGIAPSAIRLTDSEAFGILETDKIDFELVGNGIEGGSARDLMEAINTSKVFRVGEGDAGDKANIAITYNGKKYSFGVSKRKSDEKLRTLFADMMNNNGMSSTPKKGVKLKAFDVDGVPFNSGMVKMTTRSKATTGYKVKNAKVTDILDDGEWTYMTDPIGKYGVTEDPIEFRITKGTIFVSNSTLTDASEAKLFVKYLAQSLGERHTAAEATKSKAPFKFSRILSNKKVTDDFLNWLASSLSSLSGIELTRDDVAQAYQGMDFQSKVNWELNQRALNKATDKIGDVQMGDGYDDLLVFIACGMSISENDMANDSVMTSLFGSSPTIEEISVEYKDKIRSGKPNSVTKDTFSL